MNRYIALTLIVFAILGALMYYCIANSASSPFDLPDNSGRFTKESVGNYAYIFTDTETGVQYLYVTMGNNGGLCRLENEKCD